MKEVEPGGGQGASPARGSVLQLGGNVAEEGREPAEAKRDTWGRARKLPDGMGGGGGVLARIPRMSHADLKCTRGADTPVCRVLQTCSKDTQCPGHPLNEMGLTVET